MDPSGNAGTASVSAANSPLSMTHKVPFHLPCIEQDEIEEVVHTLRSGWITTGPKTSRFENAVSRYIGCKHAIALNSCTAGLHLSLVGAGVGPGDEVITTPYTFTATISSILYAGARPVLVDIEPDGFNIDAQRIEEAITPKTRAIIPVHFAGQPCDMDAISEIARRHNLVVIEDAAHAIGARYGSRKIGAISKLTSFSFYATKNMTSAEGGMVTTDDDSVAEQIRSLSLHGLSRDAWKRYSAAGSWFYEVLRLGYKYNLSDVHASIGLCQFAKLERFLAARQRIIDIYDDAFAGIPELQLPPRDRNNRHAWHLYVIRLNTGLLRLDRAAIIKALSERGIGTSVHFIPVHLHPFYDGQFGWSRGAFPRAEATYERAISLPLYPQLEFMQDLNQVIDSVRNVIAESRR